MGQITEKGTYTHMSGLEGTTLGRYHILERLGRGGMSDVYLAHDESMNRDVAIKVVGSVHSDYLERFHREAEAIGMLNHPHILPAYDYGEHGPWHYMVMPLISNGTLRDLLQDGPLSLEEAAMLLEQIAGALQFAHDQGIVHRDIKPSNILMRDEHYAYLADFGLAKSLAEGSTITQSGNLLGTPEYMAPELADGPATTSSDLYALSVLLYQMVTGQVPFSGETPIAVYWKQLRDEPPPPSQMNPAIPPAVEYVLLRALDKDPTHRYQTADELVQAYLQAITFPDRFIDPSPASTSYDTASVESEQVALSAAPAQAPLTGGRLVLPDSPSGVPAATAVPHRRLIRRPMPKIIRRRSSRSGPPTPPPMESLTPAVVQEALTSAAPEQVVQPESTKPTRQRRSIRRKSSTSIPVTPPRPRNYVRISLIAMALFVVVFLIIAIPMAYLANQANTQAHIAATAVAAKATIGAQSTATRQAMATATAGVALTAVSGVPLLQDLLSSNTNGRWKENSTCVFTGQSYHVKVQRPNFLQSCPGNTFPITNDAISVDVSLLSGDNAGLLFRASGQQFYDFEITAQGEFFFLMHNPASSTNSTYIINNTKSNAIVLGGKNTLLVIATGDDFKFFINGIFVGEQHDETLTSGQLALVAGTLSSTSSGEARFTNLQIFKF
jgi:serine/threonine protein kinase